MYSNPSQLSIYMQPLMDCEQTLEKLAALQHYCVEDVVSASFRQLQNLSHCSNPEQILDLNLCFCKGLEAHANYLSDQTYATLSDACSSSLSHWNRNSETLAQQFDRWLGLTGA